MPRSYSFSEEERRRRSQRMTELNANPDFKKASSERMTERHADPAWKERIREAMTQLNADPEFQAAAAKRINDPDYQARRIAARWPNKQPSDGPA